jgi:hypothetical protein
LTSIETLEPDPQWGLCAQESVFDVAIWRRIDICLGVVFRRTQIVCANLARFLDLASSGGIYDDSVSPLQIMFGYTRATSEELRAIHNIDELDSGAQGKLPELDGHRWADPARATPLEVRIPIRQIIKELEQRLPLANIYRDIPRGRKGKGWKKEFLRTLKDAASEVGDLSEKQIIESVRSYRSASRLQPEVEVVS